MEYSKEQWFISYCGVPVKKIASMCTSYQLKKKTHLKVGQIDIIN